MGTLTGEVLDAEEVHLNNRNISRLTPEIPFCPILVKLLLQENRGLTTIPPAFFEHMPALQVLDLSHTSIQSLPPSISKLSSLENFILRECSMLVELPPEIGALKNLKLFDLEGTEIMYLPKDIGRLENLECLRLSLCAYADDYLERKGVEYIIPRMTVSKLTKLKELSISVNPEAEWWEVELSEAIMEELLVLPDLKTLKLYLPTANALKQFLRLERDQVPIYSSLSNFRLVFGHNEELTSCLQLDVEENFQKLEKCLKYANSEGGADEIAKLMRNARALYLRRHWTIEKLSVFDIRSLKYCLLVECNEMQTLVHQEDLYKNINKATNHCEEVVLGSLEYLGIYFMKKLQRISSGPIGRNSLSCLRILALHTCPELTSVFTGSMLDNLQNLVELIVEDCPKVNSLVTLEATPWSNGPFLPNLRRLLLLDLPELVSISSGVSIAPQLDTLLIFNCMRLNYLSVMELPRGTKEIKGEIEWWDALKCGKLTWSNVFVQLERDGRLMDQLAEDTNSLQHFHELEINLPDPVTYDFSSSLQVDQEISEDQNFDRKSLSTELTKETEHVNQLQVDLNVPSFPSETQDMLIQGILFPNLSTVAEYRGNEITEDERSQYAGKALRGQKSPVPFSRMLHNEYNEHDFKDPDHKNASMKKNTNRSSIITSTHKVKVSLGSGLEGPVIDDGYRWRKYGQKDILGQRFPRSYFRCAARHVQGCKAAKQVQRCEDDPTTFEITYMRKHTCLGVSRTRDFSTAKEPAAITWNSFEHAKHPEVLDPARKTSRSNSTTKWTQQVKVNLKEELEVLPDDGHIWRKHGQKDILGQRYPRYYTCIYRKTEQCMAKKQVKRCNDDESVLEITYKGVHTCLRASITNNFSVSTESPSRMLMKTSSESAFELANSHSSMKSRSSSSITGKSVQMKMNLDKGNGVPPDDGYLWRKYGHKLILNCKYKRHYYRCSGAKSCHARKQVLRSEDDPSVMEITYQGSHNCRDVSRTIGSSPTRSAPRIPMTDDSSVATGSTSTVTNDPGDVTHVLEPDGGLWFEL